MSTKISLALAAVAATLVSPLQATTVIDSFNDVSAAATNGMTLTVLNTVGVGGVGFTSKYLQTGSGVPVLRTNDLTVSLVNYVSGQTTNAGLHFAVAATVASSGAARRTQTRNTPTLFPNIWFSFLASLQNASGDVALTFNGAFNGSGVANDNTIGMRVGLGNASLPGAMGVGPLANASGDAPLTAITNGVNGAITADNFVPVNGTAGLVLGLISSDTNTGYPRVDLWYNPDAPSAADLPPPALTFIDSNYLFVPTSVSSIGYQVNRRSPAAQDEIIDNVKVSDETNAFDIVYLDAPLPLPTISVTATVPVGSDVGPTNVVFTLTSDRPVASAVTVSYGLAGVATNGYVPFSSPPAYVLPDFMDTNFDPNTQSSSVTIPSGQTNTTVTLFVEDNGVPKAIEPVTITLAPASDNSYVLGASSASATIVPGNDANTSVQYMFASNFLAQIWDTNMTAAPANATGVGSTWSTAYNNTGYGAQDYPCPDVSLCAPNLNVATNSEPDALAAGSFISFDIGPVAGRALTLTNVQFMALYGDYLDEDPGATGAVVFVRSSLDDFATDLGSFVLLPAEFLFPNPGWYTNNVVLGSSFADLDSVVEFRFYIYDDAKIGASTGVRMGNVFFAGGTSPLASGFSQVSVAATVTNAALPGAAGQFTITRLGGASASALTVYYNMSGTASNGVEYAFLPGSATIPAGQSNVVVTVTPLDNGQPEPALTAVMTLVSGPDYGVLSPSFDTINLAPNGRLPGLVVWQFNEANNSAPSLVSVAAASVNSPGGVPIQVAGLNAVAGSGLGVFGMNGPGTEGYGTSLFYSPPSCFYINNSVLATNEAFAVASNDYVSFTIGALAGNTLALTNFTAEVTLDPGDGQTNWAVLRSSADNFASDLGSITIPDQTGNANPWLLWSVPLAVMNSRYAAEYRVYVYTSSANGGLIFRLDDATFQGSVTNLAAGIAPQVAPFINQITLNNGTNVNLGFIGGVSDTAASFALQSAAALNQFSDVPSAVITGGGVSFQAATTTNGAAQFYRIRR